MRGIRAFAITTIIGTLGLTLGAAAMPADNEATQSVRKKVVVRDNFFEPRSVNVHKGDKVVWVWRGENSHNVTFVKVPKGAGKRGAETRDHGSKWSRVFRKRGPLQVHLHDPRRDARDDRRGLPAVAGSAGSDSLVGTR